MLGDDPEVDRRTEAELERLRRAGEAPDPESDVWRELVRERIRCTIEDEVAGKARNGAVPHCPTLTEFLAMDFPPRVSLMGPWSTQQVTLVYAPAGAGKTMFCLSLAYAMAEGKPFCGWVPGKPVRVLYVDAEMAAADMNQRLAGLQSDNLRIANLAGWGAEQGLPPVNIATEAGQRTIEAWMEQDDIEALWLDNLMSLAWQDSVSMNDAKYWEPVQRWVTKLRARKKAIALVDHTNPSGDVYGTKTKKWHVDQAIRLSPIEGDEDEIQDFDRMNPRKRIMIRFDKERAAEKPQVARIATIGRVGHPWDWSNAELSLRDRAIQDRKNGMSIRDIAEELQVPKSTVARWTKDAKS